MEFEDDDVIKFYDLHNSFNLASFNIGVVGSDRKFRLYMRQVLDKFKKLNCRIIKNETGSLYRIIYGDVEYCYIHIQNSLDLRGRTFRKFV